MESHICMEQGSEIHYAQSPRTVRKPGLSSMGDTSCSTMKLHNAYVDFVRTGIVPSTVGLVQHATDSLGLGTAPTFLSASGLK